MKDLLSKDFLTKYLSKLLLLVLLTFSGCEMIRHGFNQTIDIPHSSDDTTPN